MVKIKNIYEKWILPKILYILFSMKRERSIISLIFLFLYLKIFFLFKNSFKKEAYYWCSNSLVSPFLSFFLRGKWFRLRISISFKRQTKSIIEYFWGESMIKIKNIYEKWILPKILYILFSMKRERSIVCLL